MDRYRAAAADPDTSGRIRADIADAHKSGISSLPTVYIGREAFPDARATAEDLVAALRRAAAEAEWSCLAIARRRVPAR